MNSPAYNYVNVDLMRLCYMFRHHFVMNAVLLLWLQLLAAQKKGKGQGKAGGNASSDDNKDGSKACTLM